MSLDELQERIRRAKELQRRHGWTFARAYTEVLIDEREYTNRRLNGCSEARWQRRTER
jgi:hypothetical protein